MVKNKDYGLLNDMLKCSKHDWTLWNKSDNTRYTTKDGLIKHGIDTSSGTNGKHFFDIATSMNNSNWAEKLRYLKNLIDADKHEEKMGISDYIGADDPKNGDDYKKWSTFVKSSYPYKNYNLRSAKAFVALLGYRLLEHAVWSYPTF